MITNQNLVLKKLGVMNITPNSFSDGGELDSERKIVHKLKQFEAVDGVDIGAESTAPMNESISWKEEWSRWEAVLPLLKGLTCILSVDTYHVETIQRISEFYLKQDLKGGLIWNDVSGKFDDDVLDFLKISEQFQYVFCHNLAPTRELSGQHMKYISATNGEKYLKEVAEYFSPFKHPRVIFDPCFGFSKTYEQNWMLIDHMESLITLVNHNKWLIGLSRKSFLRKKYHLELSQLEELDRIQLIELERLIMRFQGGQEIWIRTHRPELLRP